jgi:hypothetical protein
MTGSSPRDATRGGRARFSGGGDSGASVKVCAPAGLGFLTHQDVPTPTPPPGGGLAAPCGVLRGHPMIPTGRKVEKRSSLVFLQVGKLWGVYPAIGYNGCQGAGMKNGASRRAVPGRSPKGSSVAASWRSEELKTEKPGWQGDE